ncbi:hypothetical protein E1212_15345 [Jiangella ureilytica]|uniref:Uncharacterized protein n=1 Tax=Jiangella ureilytica TaxID=2530374 RepID=A0A4V6PB34_9ACTN|nr:hypothetical protein [Jiangella ureilytica]TDC50405.1 hypothetical protein E1212_15345 [Jiangella ureilytica]
MTKRMFTLAIDRIPTETELRGIDRAVVESAGLAWASLSDGRFLAHVRAESPQEARRVVESLGLGLRVLDDGALAPKVGTVGLAVRDLEQAFDRMVLVLAEARAAGHGDEALSAVLGADGEPVIVARKHLATLSEAAETVLPGGPKHPAVGAAVVALRAVGHSAAERRPDSHTVENDATQL